MSSGLLFVYAQLGADVTEPEFEAWYDVHGPARLTVPGFNNALRYRAIDEKEHKWLAVYDMTTADVAFGAEYKALSGNPTPADRDMSERAQSINRRVYDLISTVEASARVETPTEYALIVTFRVQKELDAEFNAWYNEEHLPLLSKVPGFARARRYKLVDSVEIARQPESVAPQHNYLAFYDVDRADYSQLPEFNAAVQTPASVKMISTAEGVDIRMFTLHKVLQAK